jgi:hypothetical protein
MTRVPNGPSIALIATPSKYEMNKCGSNSTGPFGRLLVVLSENIDQAFKNN